MKTTKICIILLLLLSFVSGCGNQNGAIHVSTKTEESIAEKSSTVETSTVESKTEETEPEESEDEITDPYEIVGAKDFAKINDFTYFILDNNLVRINEETKKITVVESDVQGFDVYEKHFYCRSRREDGEKITPVTYKYNPVDKTKTEIFTHEFGGWFLDKKTGTFYYTKSQPKDSLVNSPQDRNVYSCDIDGKNEKLVIGSFDDPLLYNWSQIYVSDGQIFFTQQAPKMERRSELAYPTPIAYSLYLYTYFDNELKKITLFENSNSCNHKRCFQGCQGGHNVFNVVRHGDLLYLSIGMAVPDGYEGEIYIIKTDGTGFKLIDENRHPDINVINGYVYYNKRGNGHFGFTEYSKRMTLNGDKIEEVDDGGGEVFYSDAEYLYRCGFDDNKLYLYKTDLLGENKEILIETYKINANEMVIETYHANARYFDGWIYYNYHELLRESYQNAVTSDVYYYRIKSDGTNNELLLKSKNSPF